MNTKPHDSTPGLFQGTMQHRLELLSEWFRKILFISSSSQRPRFQLVRVCWLFFFRWHINPEKKEEKAKPRQYLCIETVESEHIDKNISVFVQTEIVQWWSDIFLDYTFQCVNGGKPVDVRQLNYYSCLYSILGSVPSTQLLKLSWYRVCAPGKSFLVRCVNTKTMYVFAT